jgi:hypothetical protein
MNDELKAPAQAPQIYTFKVEFVLQVLARSQEEAETICSSTGGYIISRKQELLETTPPTA